MFTMKARAVSQVNIPKSRQSGLGSHCRGVYTPEIVTQDGGQHLLTRDNVWLFEKVNTSSGDEKMVGFCSGQDVTQHGHQDLDEAKICIYILLPLHLSLHLLWEF